MGDIISSLVSNIVAASNSARTNSYNLQAQRETNEANLARTRETNSSNQAIARMNNDMQYRIANEANAFNRETAQMTNDFNAAEAEKNRQFQLDMWNQTFEKQNEYNSPAAQAERYRAAGLNPTLMMSNGASSVSSGGSSASGATASAGNSIGAVTPNVGLPYNQQPAPVQALRKTPFLANLTGALELGNALFGMTQQHKMNNATLEQMEKMNAVLAAQALNLDSNINMIGLNPYLRDFYKSTNFGAWYAANLMNTGDQNLANMQVQNQIMNAQKFGLDISNDMNLQYLQKYFNPAQMLNINLQIAGIFQQYMSGELSRSQIKVNVEQCLKIAAERENITLGNKALKQTVDAYIASMKSQYEYYKDYYNFLRGRIVADEKIRRGQNVTSLIGNLVGAGMQMYVPMRLGKMGNRIGTSSFNYMGFDAF